MEGKLFSSFKFNGGDDASPFRVQSFQGTNFTSQQFSNLLNQTSGTLSRDGKFDRRESQSFKEVFKLTIHIHLLSSERVGAMHIISNFKFPKPFRGKGIQSRRDDSRNRLGQRIDSSSLDGEFIEHTNLRKFRGLNVAQTLQGGNNKLQELSHGRLHTEHFRQSSNSNLSGFSGVEYQGRVDRIENVSVLSGDRVQRVNGHSLLNRGALVRLALNVRKEGRNDRL